MIAILSLSALLLCSPATTPQEPGVDTSKLSAELIVGHPGLLSGDFESVRSDLLEAMLQDRSSPLLGAAANRVLQLAPYCPTPMDPSILAELIEGVDNGAASTDLRRLYFGELQRSRFQDLSPLQLPARPAHANDLFDSWFTHWRVLQPWGELDHPQPMRAGTVPPDPRQLEVVDPANGQTRTWQPLLRRSNQTLVRPDQYAWKSVGSGYAAIWLRAEPQVATLELHADEAVRAWWNGMPTFEALREGIDERQSLQQAYVTVQAGWNLLLVQYEVGDDLRLGGRLLTRDGRLLPSFEWQDDVNAPELPAVPMPAEILDVPYWEPAGTDPWNVILRCVLALQHDRADIALATPEPLDMTAQQMAAWLHWQHRALSEAYHLPASIMRNRLIEMEARSAELGCNNVMMEIFAARRLREEDKREEALTMARTLVAAHPNHYGARLLEASILLEIDSTGTLAKPALDALTESYPQADWPLLKLEEFADDHGDRAGALKYAKARLTTSPTAGWNLIGLLLESNEPAQVQLARTMLARIEVEEPQHPSTERLRRTLWRLEGKQGALLAELRADVTERPNFAGSYRALANYQLRHGALEEAVSAYQRVLELDPSHTATLQILKVLERRDDAATFFDTFGPDVMAQMAKRDSVASDNSTAMLLDSGMVYMLANGGMIYRVHNLDLAMDRNGTEILHEMGVSGEPQLARVITSDGGILEPHQVNGSLVMPSLDPGDVIETIFDRYMPGLFGVAGVPGDWRFSSFEKPFALSRWVIYVPNGATGFLREQNFDGTHEILDWQDGKVHIFTREDSPRLEPEVLMPSEMELLPWVAFGNDSTADRAAEDWRAYFRWQTSVPADIELELRAFLATLDQTGTHAEVAARIYDAISELILDFGDDGDLVDVWTLKRGNPTFLLATLYRLAGIPHEWAILQATAPELNETPMKTFASFGDFQLPALRIADNGEEPIWMFVMTRGTNFGDLDPSMLGAEAMILEPEGHRIEEISREGLNDLWDMDLGIAYSVQTDDSADVTGKLTMGGVQGAAIREAISQLSPQEVDQALRQLSSQMVKGLDLRTAQVIDIEVAGGPLIIDFDGVIPDFVQRRENSNGARLRIPELGLADGLGPAERQYTFVLRAAQRVRTSVQLDAGPTWTLEYGPMNSTETREGFRYDFQVEKDAQHLMVRRTLEMRGVTIPAADFPGFIATMKELENQETRAVRLVEVIPEEVIEEVAPEEEPDSGSGTQEQ
jgi:tetratricopeptide (TPR) repeat protein